MVWPKNMESVYQFPIFKKPLGGLSQFSRWILTQSVHSSTPAGGQLSQLRLARRLLGHPGAGPRGDPLSDLGAWWGGAQAPGRTPQPHLRPLRAALLTSWWPKQVTCLSLASMERETRCPVGEGPGVLTSVGVRARQAFRAASADRVVKAPVKARCFPARSFPYPEGRAH